MNAVDVLGRPWSTVAHSIDSVVHDSMSSVVDKDQGFLLAGCPVLDHVSLNTHKEIFQVIEACIFNDVDVGNVRTKRDESVLSVNGVLVDIGDVCEGGPVGVLSKNFIVLVFDDDPVATIWNKVCFLCHEYVFSNPYL